MTTNKPVELGKVSEQTKQPGFGMPDNINVPHGEPLA
jgi:hypothetical protein